MSEYPEHEKLSKVKDQSQAIGDFYQWLSWEKGYQITEFVDKLGEYVVVSKSIDNLLAEFFNIDRDKLESEKQQMLEEMRNVNRTT